MKEIRHNYPVYQLYNINEVIYKGTLVFNETNIKVQVSPCVKFKHTSVE